ncbi:MAG TPA: hypothetical protein VM682_03905, partial [Bacillus sp. (in: firmicutes)]|nr:hypothetical protein [Bacillus sp. (in: firmicutes)]
TPEIFFNSFPEAPFTETKTWDVIKHIQPFLYLFHLIFIFYVSSFSNRLYSLLNEFYDKILSALEMLIGLHQGG